MTRKAMRKKRQQSAKHTTPRTTPQSSSSWMTVGTVVASTAMTGLLPATASARPLSSATSPANQSRVLRAFFGEAAVLQQSPTAAAASATHAFEIPSGPFADVLRAFEHVTGMHVALAIESIGSVQSPGVTGVMTSEQALEAIVAGTSVQFHVTSAESAVLDLAVVPESVDVSVPPPNVTVTSPKYTQPLRDTL